MLDLSQALYIRSGIKLNAIPLPFLKKQGLSFSEVTFP
tara:strand:- start:705 stop:818 length:114 start_codon:yes stop_codon:yes gene_type:complete